MGPMFNTIRKSTATVAILGAAGLGGAAIAGAADNGSSSSSSASGAQQGRFDRPQREALSSDAAAKVKAAALEQVPGATVLRTEAGGPYPTPYHAHIRTSEGAQRVVLVNADFEATGVQADRSRAGGPGRGGPGRGGHHAETALSGQKEQQVEAAVLAEYPNATIERTETNRDGSAPYESHITTTDGKELEVLVSADFEVVDAREHPARP